MYPLLYICFIWSWIISLKLLLWRCNSTSPLQGPPPCTLSLSQHNITFTWQHGTNSFYILYFIFTRLNLFWHTNFIKLKPTAWLISLYYIWLLMLWINSICSSFSSLQKQNKSTAGAGETNFYCDLNLVWLK